jgi:protein-L-isoaspartate(D-aspartate) O-methyltransferase
MQDFACEREELVRGLQRIGVLKNPRIARAMLAVKRELFVTKDYASDAYADIPLPIPGGATISQPYVYASTLEAADLKEGENVLEIGAGSGYGAALMSELVGRSGRVFTIEISPKVSGFAKVNLKKAGYNNVKLITSDGSMGYEKESPYDAIIVTAACPEIPPPLIEQLKVGGRIVAPVGGLSEGQELMLLKKKVDGSIETRRLGGVVFLPLTGKHGYKA